MKKLAFIVVLFMFFAANLSAQSDSQGHQLTVTLSETYAVYLHGAPAVAALTALDSTGTALNGVWTNSQTENTSKLGYAHTAGAELAKIVVSLDTFDAAAQTAWAFMDARVKLPDNAFGAVAVNGWVTLVDGETDGGAAEVGGIIVNDLPAADLSILADSEFLLYEVRARPGALAGAKTLDVVYTISQK